LSDKVLIGAEDNFLGLGIRPQKGGTRLEEFAISEVLGLKWIGNWLIGETLL